MWPIADHYDSGVSKIQVWIAYVSAQAGYDTVSQQLCRFIYYSLYQWYKLGFECEYRESPVIRYATLIIRLCWIIFLLECPSYSIIPYSPAFSTFYEFFMHCVVLIDLQGMLKWRLSYSTLMMPGLEAMRRFDESAVAYSWRFLNRAESAMGRHGTDTLFSWFALDGCFYLLSWAACRWWSVKESVFWYSCHAHSSQNVQHLHHLPWECSKSVDWLTARQSRHP